ncbi:MAG: glycosyltransferase family 39 protein [Acidobacteria bacterium]|nr:glycosyltransferase family 39 protein [Acidobacteriota bacterium]
MLAKRLWLLLLALVCAVYFYGLGYAPLLGPDEPRYAQVAREMFMRGDWVTPTLGGHTWFEKPALLYWLMMTAYGAFGVSEFSARFSSAIAGVLTVLLVGWLGSRVERATGEQASSLGLLSAVVMASSAGLIVFARGASFDILLTVTVTAALACFFVSELEESETRRRWFLAGFYACVGVSLLAKGLVGVVIPCGVVGLFYLLRRRRPRLIRLGILWGPLLGVAVAGMWYGPVIERHGWKFVDEFFVQHHFARYLSNKYRHPQPVYYYLPIIALMAMPWTAFLLKSLASSRLRDMRADGALSEMRVFALAWLVVPVAFFSISGSKLPGYIVPALPGAALLASEQLARYLRAGEGRNYMRLTGAALLALFVGGIVYTWGNFSPDAFGIDEGRVSYGCALAILLPAGAAGAFALLASRRRLAAMSLIVVAAFLTVILIAGCALEKITRRESVRVLVRQASAEGYDGLPVFQLHRIMHTAEFYAAGRLLYDAQGEPLRIEGVGQVVEAARRAGGSALVLVPREFAGQLTAEPLLETRNLGDNGSIAIIFVRVRS